MRQSDVADALSVCRMFATDLESLLCASHMTSAEKFRGGKTISGVKNSYYFVVNLQY